MKDFEIQNTINPLAGLGLELKCYGFEPGRQIAVCEPGMVPPFSEGVACK